MTILRFTLALFVFVQLGSVFNLVNGSAIYETSQVSINDVDGQVSKEVPYRYTIEDPCLPGSLPYINLIMNITHRQWKSSLGEPTSNITKILDDTSADSIKGNGSGKITNGTISHNMQALDTATYHQNFTDGAIYWTRNTGAH